MNTIDDTPLNWTEIVQLCAKKKKFISLLRIEIDPSLSHCGEIQVYQQQVTRKQKIKNKRLIQGHIYNIK